MARRPSLRFSGSWLMRCSMSYAVLMELRNTIGKWLHCTEQAYDLAKRQNLSGRARYGWGSGGLAPARPRRLHVPIDPEVLNHAVSPITPGLCAGARASARDSTIVHGGVHSPCSLERDNPPAPPATAARRDPCPTTFKQALVHDSDRRLQLAWRQGQAC
jgi:hypothetical protein